MNPDDDADVDDDDDDDEFPLPSSPYGPQPYGEDEAAGGADSSPFESVPAEERKEVAEIEQDITDGDGQ